MSAAILSKWAVFFTFWSVFCSSFSEFSPNFYHPSENSNFSGDSSWDSHSMLLLLLQLPSIRPGATETPLTSNSCPAASTAIPCFLNFSVHQKKLISGAFRNAEKGKERCSSFGGAKKLCTLTQSLSLETAVIWSLDGEGTTVGVWALWLQEGELFLEILGAQHFSPRAGFNPLNANMPSSYIWKWGFSLQMLSTVIMIRT